MKNSKTGMAVGVGVMVLACELVAWSAATAKADEHAHANAHESGQKAHAVIQDAKGKQVGTATFTQTETGVKIMVEAKGLPAGAHGMHIHQVGQCQGPDFKSAGPHLSMAGKEHGLENPKGPHSGDLPNLQVGKDGTARAEILAKNVMFDGPSGLMKEGGTALVIHAQGDDNRSQPAGASGDRIACGVIERQSK